MLIDPESMKQSIDHKYWASKFFSFDWSYQRSDDYSVWSKWDSRYKELSQKASNENWTSEDEVRILQNIKEIYFDTFGKEINKEFYEYLTGRVAMFAEKGRKNVNQN